MDAVGGGGNPDLRGGPLRPGLVGAGEVRDHYQHLLSQGKAKKVALVACMRKLLIYLNSILNSILTEPKNA